MTIEQQDARIPVSPASLGGRRPDLVTPLLLGAHHRHVLGFGLLDSLDEGEGRSCEVFELYRIRVDVFRHCPVLNSSLYQSSEDISGRLVSIFLASRVNF